MAFRSLRPAMVLCVIAAFEGFTEDFLAAALQMEGYTLHQIGEKANFTNPDLNKVEERTDQLIKHAVNRKGDGGFGLELWRSPVGDSGWWAPVALTWKETKDAATAWMQVRHCLAHGVASGWGSERWPSTRPPRQLTEDEVKLAAPFVLRETEPERYSLALRCAVNCCRVYRYGAQHLADQIAKHFDEVLDWSKVPDFALEE